MASLAVNHKSKPIACDMGDQWYAQSTYLTPEADLFLRLKSKEQFYKCQLHSREDSFGIQLGFGCLA